MRRRHCSFVLMLRFCFVFILFTLLLGSCGNQQPAMPDDDFSNYVPPEDGSINTADPVYPYLDYIRAQMKMVDTIPYAIERILTINGMTVDSGFVSKDVFKKEAQAFLDIDPNKKGIRENYTEISFKDNTLGLITFSISSKQPGLTLQHADVLVHPDNHSVKNLILRKQFSGGDSTVEQTLLWKDKRHFQISEVISKKDQTLYNRVLKIIWDKPLE